MRDEIRVLDAALAGRLPQAADLIIEYVAGTQDELGRWAPQGPVQLPSSLAVEYRHPGVAYPPPGTILIAERAGHAIGCVALKYLGSSTAEVKRLYVRPADRGGVGTALMVHLHEHAERHGLNHLVLDVLMTRQHAIALYRALGYTDIESSAAGAALLMERHFYYQDNSAGQ